MSKKFLITRTKVLLTSEDQMELMAEHDFGTIKDNDKKWVYRRVAHICSEVKDVVEYNKEKTLVRMWNEDAHLVFEPFDQVVAKWEECKDCDIEAEEDHHEPEIKGIDDDDDEPEKL